MDNYCVISIIFLVFIVGIVFFKIGQSSCGLSKTLREEMRDNINREIQYVEHLRNANKEIEMLRHEIECMRKRYE